MITVVCAVRDLGEESAVLKNIGDNRPGQVVLVEGRSPSYQRNAGVKEASGSIIYYIDDDSVLPPGIIAAAEKYLAANPSCAVLGGPELVPAADTPLQRSFGAVFASPFAAGKSCNRYRRHGAVRETSEKEMILCNMFVRKEVFEELNGFNESLYPNEENEFLARVAERGLKIVHDPALFILRSKRKDYPGFIRQCFNYGRGRAEQASLSFSLNDLVNFVPAFFVIYLASEAAIGGMGLLPMALYAAADAFFSVRAGIEYKDGVLGAMCFLDFFILHVSYGIGTLAGFFTSFTLKDRLPDTNIRVKKTDMLP